MWYKCIPITHWVYTYKNSTGVSQRSYLRSAVLKNFSTQKTQSQKPQYSKTAVINNRSTKKPKYSKTALLKIRSTQKPQFLKYNKKSKNIDNFQIILQKACTASVLVCIIQKHDNGLQILLGADC